MRKLAISCAALLLSCFTSLFAQQTGVNTKNPQGRLHVDSKKNNAATGAPTGIEPDDDFIIDANGNVSIGTINTSTRLRLNSATPGAIRIVDGNEGVGKLLISDASGVGTWFAPAVTRSSVRGVFPASTVISPASPYGGFVNTGQYIVLGPGKWVVSAGLTIESNPIGQVQMGWGHAWLSTNTTAREQVGFTHLGPAGATTAYAGVLHGNFLTYTPTTPRISFISGSSLIQVTGTSPLTIYLLIEKFSYTYRTSAPQNYFYAVPVN